MTGAWEEVRHQAAIAGRVTDVQLGQPVPGAMVAIVSGPPAFDDLLTLQALRFGSAWPNLSERADRTRTQPDGHFHFLDLPDGPYTLVASLPAWGTRYATAQASVSVTRTADGAINLARSDLALPATSIIGRVLASDGTALPLAKVRVQGGDECAFSDSGGHYQLIGVEAGNRTLVAAAQNFVSVTQTVQLGGPGAVQTVNLTLARASG
jgi:hypothetical protein